MANRVHTAMESMQATGADSPPNRALRIAERPLQLAHRDDAMLALRHLPERSMTGPRGARLSFLPHSGGKDCRACSLPR